MEPGRNSRPATVVGRGRSGRGVPPELLGSAEGVPECECVRTVTRGR